jgi:hypothetical protein
LKLDLVAPPELCRVVQLIWASQLIGAPVHSNPTRLVAAGTAALLIMGAIAPVAAATRQKRIAPAQSGAQNVQSPGAARPVRAPDACALDDGYGRVRSCSSGGSGGGGGM